MMRSPTPLFAAALLAGICLCGCDTLPRGNPPEGPLADNTPPRTASPAAVRNRRVTALITYALQSGLRELAAADATAAAVARDAACVAGFSVLPPAPGRAALRSDGGGLALVAPDGVELWRCE